MKIKISVFLLSLWLCSVVMAHAQTVAAPLLSVRLTPTNTVLVSWPAPSIGFELQQTKDLSAMNWGSVALPVTVGVENQVAVIPSGGGRFFRLENQAASATSSGSLLMFDPAANITDVYAFVHVDSGQKRLMTAMNVYPYEEPAMGAHNYNFDERVLYAIHVAIGSDVAAGRPTFSYEFRFTNQFKAKTTILRSYLGVIAEVNDAGQNLVQAYSVTKVDNRTGSRTSLGSGIVPSNNQGTATPYYNQGDNGENPARDGVSTTAELDRYTSHTVTNLSAAYTSFAGQRDDGFYGDLQSIFDLLQLRSPGKDSRGGFNLHMIGLDIPVVELGGTQQVVGVYATTSRHNTSGGWTQVARRGNPLFNELFVPIEDQDVYNRSNPTQDDTLFRKYAEKPELARLMNLLVFGGSGPAIESNRTDIAGIYIPDFIKVDLSTPGAPLAGSGPSHPTNPDDLGFSRLGIFGGDVLPSAVQDPFGNNGLISGGWPNGRRFGDDVIDIAFSALLSDLRGPLIIRVADGVDGVNRNDQGFHKVFPYQGTPHNGRNHAHP
jgi:hypothetical protein